MPLVVLVLVAGVGVGVALASLQVGYSGWAAFGLYALTIDMVAVACLIGGLLIRWLVSFWSVLVRSARVWTASSPPEPSR